ncbi:MAG: TetR/AcrR family transcriptional regulator [Candidatus Kapabacteria bacterium]|jgi:TetR/AcrR family transcriptional repressor of nem operon|nr:TetR/AcrR family transcriptional regulator [Candidatus Kapabacteria bacterium]
MPLQKITREEILNKCVERFRTHGFHRTTMHELAEVCGLQKGSFYHYFSSKDDILREGLAQTRDYFADHVFTLAFDNKHSPKKRMKSMLERHAQIMLRGNGGCLIANIAAETLNSEPEFATTLRDVSDRWHAALMHILRSQYEPQTAETLAWKIMQDVEGGIMLTRLYNDETFLRQATERAVGNLSE